MSEEDPYNLSRFLEAQERPWQGATIYDQALSELRARAKRTHWIWFVFPQIAGLGHSPTAQFFAISGLNEARAYLEHDRLGPRLIEASEALLLQSLKSPNVVACYGRVLPRDPKNPKSEIMFLQEFCAGASRRFEPL